MSDLVALAEEYQVPYWRLLHHAALHESRLLRGNQFRYLPARPLLQIMARAGKTQDDFAAACQVHEDTVGRWIRLRTIPVNAADRAAIAVGEHPAYIWGNDWHAIAALMENVKMRRKKAS